MGVSVLRATFVRLPEHVPATPWRKTLERRYGQTGLEWYQHMYFVEIDGIWQPEDPAHRMVTVQW
jgi:hypothetical protein